MQTSRQPARHALAAFGATLLLILAAGCSGSGSGGSGSDGGHTATKHLGSRAVPGYEISVSRLSPVLAGAELDLQVELVGPRPDSVALWLAESNDYDGSADLVPAQHVEGGTWRGSLTLPDPLPASLGVYVQVTGADGNISEAGIDDFRLMP